MITFLAGFILGVVASFIALTGWFLYHYTKALKQAHEEGWDMPN
jgi:hypothetical protein